MEKKTDLNYLKRDLDNEGQVEEDINKLSREDIISKLQVKDFMQTDVKTLSPESTIGEAIKLLKENSLSGVPVTDKSGKVSGIITDYDLLLQAGRYSMDQKITYSKNVFTVHSDATLKEILITFYKYRLRRVPVVDAFQKVVGLVSRKDVIFAIAEKKS